MRTTTKLIKEIKELELNRRDIPCSWIRRQYYQDVSLFNLIQYNPKVPANYKQKSQKVSTMLIKIRRKQENTDTEEFKKMPQLYSRYPSERRSSI